VIHLYIRVVYATNRWTVVGAEIPHRLRADGRSFILAFWHGRLLMIPMAWQRLAPMHMLISAHRDGRIIADASPQQVLADPEVKRYVVGRRA